VYKNGGETDALLLRK